MKKQAANAMYGAVDYASYPLGMLLVAPVILRSAGAAEYGLWMVCTAIVSAGGIIASGFCDAGLQRVARLHGAQAMGQMKDAFRAMFAVTLSLGCLSAVVMWIASPIVARRLAMSNSVSLEESLICLRIASVLILIRAVEAVSVSAQRAFEHYRGNVQINTIVRFLTLGSAAILALLGKRTESIMTLTAVFLGAGVLFQFRHLRNFIPVEAFRPDFHPEEMRHLVRSGSFAWLQVLGSIVFRQLDRILLGISLGAVAVTAYSLCIQLAEPLFGFTASSLSFIFPYLSGRLGVLSRPVLQRAILKVFLCNLAMILCGAGLLFAFGSSFLHIWAGPAIAQNAQPILPFIVVGSALSGLSVTGTYVVQALGMFRTAAGISLASRGALLLVMVYLLHHHGVYGLAIARVFYGGAALLIYVPLIRHFGPDREVGLFTAQRPITAESREGAKP